LLQDIYLLVSRRQFLFVDPVQLQRWLDFLSVHSFGTREVLNFFMRAPEEVLSTTIHSASQVGVFRKDSGCGKKA
jgi:hypothetical protein